MFATPKSFVYALMPLIEEFDNIYKYGVKVACENAGTYSERIEKHIHQGDILLRMYNQIAKADLIVADLTEQCLDVFYGIGYAHALGKSVILISQRTDDIPNDLIKHAPVIYDANILNINKLQRELEEKINYFLQTLNSKERLQFPLAFYIDGQRLSDHHPIEIDYKLSNRDIIGGESKLNLKIDINNKSNTMFDKMHQIGIITTAAFSIENQTQESIKTPNDKYLHLIRQTGKILPYSWDTVKVNIISRNTLEQLQQNSPLMLSIRIFTEVGIIDYPIILNLRKKKIDHVENVVETIWSVGR